MKKVKTIKAIFNKDYSEDTVKEKSKLSRNTFNKICVTILMAILIIYCISLFLPVIWTVLNSFKDPMDIYLVPSYMPPKNWAIDNYIYVLKNMKYQATTPNGRVTYGLLDMFVSSILWAVLSPLFNVFVTTLVAYVISRYKFIGRNFIFTLGIVVMILPIVGTLGSAMQLKKQLHIFDSMPLLILTGPSMAFSGLNFMILYAAFKAIPWAYAESVFMDGGGHIRVLISIMLPMILPTSAVLFLLGCISGWNDYETFLIWMPSYANIALGMYNFQSDTQLGGGNLPQILAGFVLVSIPTVILFLSFQGLITRKMVVGGLKG